MLDPVAEYLIERPEIVLEEAAGESFEMDQALYEAAGYDQELLASLYGLLSDHNSEIFDNLEVEGLEHVLSRDKGQGWDLIGDRLVDLVLENDFEDMTLGNLLTHRNPGVRHEAQKREEELRDRWDELKEEG